MKHNINGTTKETFITYFKTHQNINFNASLHTGLIIVFINDVAGYDKNYDHVHKLTLVICCLQWSTCLIPVASKFK